VNVIRNLPKQGSYQPSNELMLRFYAFFKQATQGPCEGGRPSFWDVVGRAKYDAWKNLGKMPKAEAMKLYVDELHKIVETMSYTDNVADFLEAPTTALEALNMSDLELVAGDVIERVRSQPNSPIASREASPQRYRTSSIETSPATSPSPPDDSDRSDDEYIDSVEVPHEFKKPLTNGISNNSEPMMNGISHRSRPKQKTVSVNANHVDISQEISVAVQSLRADIEKLNSKVASLENLSKNLSAMKKREKVSWKLKDIPPAYVTFIVVWPFVTYLIMNRLTNRK